MGRVKPWSPTTVAKTPQVRMGAAGKRTKRKGNCEAAETHYNSKNPPKYARGRPGKEQKKDIQNSFARQASTGDILRAIAPSLPAHGPERVIPSDLQSKRVHIERTKGEGKNPFFADPASSNILRVSAHGKDQRKREKSLLCRPSF
jgi:hypothetical protein